jgi:NADH:ubiquinone oxidoreductase subunit E
LKGSYDVIEAFRGEIAKRSLLDKVELKAAFCLGKCGFDGVTIKIGEKVITGITVEKVASVFDEEIIPLTK